MSSYIDSEIETMIKKMSVPDSDSAIKKEINNLLFHRYCAKGYLNECEPEYCSDRYLGSCKYIKALHELQEVYKIKVFEANMNDCWTEDDSKK